MRPLVMLLVAVSVYGQQVDYNSGLKNQPAWPSGAYNFPAISQSSSITAGYRTFTIKCPLGVKGTNLGPSITITNVTNNGLGVIRITAPTNSVQTGQRVTITGVGGVTAANGNWSVTRINATTFDLVSSTFSGTYTSGGVAQQNVHSLYLSGGTGTAEAVFIGGGTCNGDGKTGTIQAYVTNSHSGAYTITSATSGVMEANWAQGGTRRRVYMSTARIELHGPIWLTTDYGMDLSGGGMLSTVVRRESDYTGDLIIVDNAAGGSSLHTLHDFWLYAQYMNGAATSAGIRFRGITCCGGSAQNIKIWDETSGIIIESSDDITLLNIQYLQTRVSDVQPFAGLYVTGDSSRLGATSSGLIVDDSYFTTSEGYITTMPTVSGTASGSGGKVRLTISSNPYVTGDRVTVFGVGGTTEANGSWTITRIDSTHIDLDGSTYANAYTAGGTTMFKNVMQNGMYIEGADGIAVSNTTFRGEFGVRYNAIEVASGLFVSNSTIDRVRYSAVAIAAATSGLAQGQIVFSNSWLTGNYYPSYPGIIIDMTNIPEGRFIFANNDIYGHKGSCIDLINAKGVTITGNTIGSCDLSQAGAAGVEIATAANALSLNNNVFRDTAALGATTNWWFYFNANITNSLISGNNMGTTTGGSLFYQAGTNSNFTIGKNSQLDVIPTTTVSASNIAIPTSVPAVLQVTGGGTATTMTGGWPGMVIKVWTVAATTFNTGGANPGNFGGAYTSSAGQWVVFEMASDGTWYKVG